MNFNKILVICKKCNSCCIIKINPNDYTTLGDGEVYEGEESIIQWLGASAALYKLDDCMPPVDIDYMPAMLNLSEKAEEKVNFTQKDNYPEDTDWGDKSESDKLLDIEQFAKIRVDVKGKTLIPFETSAGLMYINEMFFDPFVGDNIEIYEREGRLVIKRGGGLCQEIKAVIYPYKNDGVIDEDYVKALERYTIMCKRELNKMNDEEG